MSERELNETSMAGSEIADNYKYRSYARDIRENMPGADCRGSTLFRTDSHPTHSTSVFVSKFPRISGHCESHLRPRMTVTG